MLLETPVSRTRKITKLKHREREPKTSSILLISIAISMAIILSMWVGVGIRGGMYFEQHSICRDKIIGFEQSGLYPNQAAFRLALSFCDLK
jgi:hypothetical protein